MWRVEFLSDKAGEMDTELSKEWVPGVNAIRGAGPARGDVLSHQVVVSCFKALAQALREAV